MEDSAPKPLRFQPVESQVDTSVDAIAGTCGVAPEVVGLVMSAIIGGLARQDHDEAIVPVLRGLSPGFNLLLVGGDEEPRLQWLLSILLSPLLSHQSRLREASSVCRKSELDKIIHGAEDREMLDDRTRDVVQRFREGPLDHPFGLGTGSLRRREFDAVTHPSVFLSNPLPGTINTALEEALDGQLLALDGDGTLIRQLCRPARNERDFASALRVLLAPHGSDVIMGEVDPRRGPGSMETRLLRLISVVSRQEMVGLLERGSRQLPSSLDSFLVIDVTRAVRPSQRNSTPSLTEALKTWDRAVAQVLSQRLSGRGIAQTPDERVSDHLLHLMEEYHHALGDKETPPGLPAGALWALPLQLYTGLGAVTPWACPSRDGMATILPRLGQLAIWAAEHHLSTLSGIQGEASEQEICRRRDSILRALDRHGPCSFRVVLRTFSIQRKELYEPLVSDLIAEGQVLERNDGLLSLPGAPQREPQSRKRQLNR